MDIVVLEKKAFEQLIDETRRLTQRVESLSRKCQDKQLQKWLTGEDVCAILNGRCRLCAVSIKYVMPKWEGSSITAPKK